MTERVSPLSKRVLVLPDLQCPLEDRPLVSRVLDFASSYAPDEIYCVGDEADSTELGRWVKGLAEEYAPTLQSALNETASVMGAFAQVAPGWWLEGAESHAAGLRGPGWGSCGLGRGENFYGVSGG